MKASQKIQQLKRDLRLLFGDDDPAFKALELKEWYLKAAAEFQRLRDVGYSYQESLDRTCVVFYCSESTCKRAIKFYNKVHNNELTL